MSTPFDSCAFAWGAMRGAADASSADFVVMDVGQENNGGLDTASIAGHNVTCLGCDLARSLSNSKAIAMFEALFIWNQACHMGGFCDCALDMDGNSLCTDGAQWIRANRPLILRMFEEYAKAVHAASPEKPTIWSLGPASSVYLGDSQSAPMSYSEYGSITRDIICAIKANQPNAVIAIEHDPWVSDSQAEGFWGAQPLDVIDLVLVPGAGDTAAFPEGGAYNAMTSNYAWLERVTGKPIIADTSFTAASGGDRWTTASAAQINARISEGVIGVLVRTPPTGYQSAIQALAPELDSTCN